VIGLRRFFALVGAVVVLGLTAFVGSAAAGDGGAYTIYPPGHDGATATCVGPVFGETPDQAGLAPWNGHFNGVAPTHDFSC
jgi:hypothetical protein